MNGVYIDYFLIFCYLLLLFFIVIKYAKGKTNFSDFFKSGGNLHWIWIAVSLLGTNIQIEYIIASASNGFSYGMALGSFEWIGAIVLIFTALYIVPYFLTAGVSTLPEYLEYRYGRSLRLVYAILFILVNLTMIMLILNSSATFLENLFGIYKEITIVTVTVIGGMIIYSGGMKVKLRLDLVVICCFIVAGMAMLIFCFVKTDGLKNFYEHSDGKLRGIFPADHKILPWTDALTGGLWMTAIFYFGFFPPIAQSFLTSNSLSEAQKGLMFASCVKMLLPFIMIVPGIVGYELFAEQITNPDFALPVVIKNVVPLGLQGLILAGYIGTLFTTYSSFLQSTATIFALDILGGVTTRNPGTDALVVKARKAIPAFVLISICFGAIFKPSEAIFSYSQMVMTCVSPIAATVFLFAIFSRKTPAIAAHICTYAGFPLFFLIHSEMDITRLNKALLLFAILSITMLTFRILFPLGESVTMPEKLKVKFERNLAVVIWGIFILTIGASIYAILI